MQDEFDTYSVRMCKAWLFEVQSPEEDVDRIMEAVVAVDPLAMTAAYDCNAFVSAPGIERYRPRDGAVAGLEEEVRERPGVVRLIFEVTSEAEGLKRLVEEIFQIHAYQEPVIRITECLTARSRGRDDSANPNRWWNRGGDWKTGT